MNDYLDLKVIFNKHLDNKIMNKFIILLSKCLLKIKIASVVSAKIVRPPLNHVK